MRILIILLALLFITMFWINSNKVYKGFYIIMNLIFLTIIFNFLIIFTSSFEFSPWHNSGSIQLLVPIYMAIWLFVIGGIFMLLDTKINIPKTIIVLPFISGIILGAIVLEIEDISFIAQIFGAGVSFMLFVMIIFFFVKSFEKTIYGKLEK